MKYIGNAFSLGMLRGDATITVKEVTIDEAKVFIAGAQSVIGHQSTADYVSLLTGIPIQANRVALVLNSGDQLLVLQLLGRLPEGVILTQDDIAKVSSKWYLVTVG